MAAEVISFKKLFKVVRKADCIKFDDVVSVLSDSTWMDISMGISIHMEKAQTTNYRFKNIQSFKSGELLLQKCFPLSEIFRCLCLDEDQLIWVDPILQNLDKVLVFEACQLLDQ